MDLSSERSCERERVDKGHLPRLSHEFYRGRAFVHWTLTVEDRATGWLTPAFHQAWQMTLLHICARYQVACPTYVLMPDHAHFLGLGLHDDSDQRLAIEFLRKHLQAALSPARWQNQAHDHVLRRQQREHGVFQTVAQYILDNPIRAGLVEQATDHPFLGCCVAGYPELNVRQIDYWEKFWRIYNRLVEKRPEATRSRS
ncbi:MAG: hypothetical protein ABI222_13750 [Opitutaceae bacterium]